jgi:hypothetical protein
VENVVACVDQRTQHLRKELNETIDETQVDLQAVNTSLDMLTKNLLETIVDTGNGLHEELGLMIKDETQKTKNLV